MKTRRGWKLSEPPILQRLFGAAAKRKQSPYVVREGADRYIIVNEWKLRILPKHTDVKAKLADIDRAVIGRVDHQTMVLKRGAKTSTKHRANIHARYGSIR